MHAPKRPCASHGPRRLWLLLLMALTLALATPAPTFAQSARKPHGPHPQIVGGTDVPNGKYPFLGTMQLTTRGDNGLMHHFCGGALIAPT